MPTTTPPTDHTAITAACAAHHLHPDEFTLLQQRAQEAKARAYCPYSRFRVGAALLTRAGACVVGANVENASYPVGTCAERVAFGTAVVGGWLVEGEKKGEGDEEGEGGKGAVKALAVATDAAGPASPCGMCRQLWVYFYFF